MDSFGFASHLIEIPLVVKFYQQKWRTFLYGDFYFLPITSINLLNFKFEKKDSFLPPESRNLKAVIPNNQFSKDGLIYKCISLLCPRFRSVTKNYNKRAAYFTILKKKIQNCSWQERVHGWQSKKEKSKENKKLDQMRGSRPSSYILANTKWQARGKYRDKDLLYAAIRPVHAIGGYQGNSGKSVKLLIEKRTI